MKTETIPSGAVFFSETPAEMLCSWLKWSPPRSLTSCHLQQMKDSSMHCHPVTPLYGGETETQNDELICPRSWSRAWQLGENDNSRSNQSTINPTANLLDFSKEVMKQVTTLHVPPVPCPPAPAPTSCTSHTQQSCPFRLRIITSHECPPFADLRSLGAPVWERSRTWCDLKPI